MHTSKWDTVLLILIVLDDASVLMIRHKTQFSVLHLFLLTAGESLVTATEEGGLPLAHCTLTNDAKSHNKANNALSVLPLCVHYLHSIQPLTFARTSPRL